MRPGYWRRRPLVDVFWAWIVIQWRWRWPVSSWPPTLDGLYSHIAPLAAWQRSRMFIASSPQTASCLT